MTQEGLWNIASKRMLEDRGALLVEEGDFDKRFQVHARRYFSQWLAEGRHRRRGRRSGGRGAKRDKEWQKGRLREKWKGSRWIAHAYFNFCSSPLDIFVRKVAGRIVFGMREECGSDCEVTECVLVGVFDLICVSWPCGWFGLGFFSEVSIQILRVADPLLL